MPSISRPSRLRAASWCAAWLLAAFALTGNAVADVATAPKVAAPVAPRWTATTPDEMVDFALARAKRGGDDALAALVVAASLDERASLGKARAGLDAFAAAGGPLADEARWLSRALTPEPLAPSWPGMAAVSYDAPPDPGGLVKSFAILGPFQDTGGGLMRREGPEVPGQSWSDASARYSWGVYEVAWRRTLPASATAAGLPLDLYIHPRAESCTYLATKVTTPERAAPIVVRVAATGAVRLIWDGADVAASDDVHQRLVLDRLAARVTPTPGDHLLALKVCSAAVNDDGRVRVRITDEQNKALRVAMSSDLGGLSIAPAKPLVEAAGKAPPAKAAKTAANKPPQKGAASKAAAAAPEGAAAITPPAGVTVIPTALEKALEVGEAPSTERALTASILRTLGGADDLRSPRAPGLLDRVARDASITPDTLAMAGWISPFGANRSGWLNLARERAQAQRDAATAAFAQRRLAAAHLSSHYVDWALSTIREEPLRSANDPEARLIKAIGKRQLGGTGMMAAALTELNAIESERKDKTPISVLQEIRNAARGQGDVRLRIARRLADVQVDGRGPSYVDAFSVESAAALETAAARSLSQQTSASDMIRIGRALLDAGRYPWAREVFYLATKLAPNQTGAFQGLAAARQGIAAREVAQGKAPSEDTARALADLSRARDLDPGDVALKSEIAFRSDQSDQGAGEHTNRKAMRDEQYVVPAATFLASAKQKPAKKGEIFDRQLHWVRVVTYHPDKRVSQLMHYSREIVIEPRTENDLYENVPAEGDETELLFARVHRKDGTVVMPEEQSGGGRRPYIRWPELKAGDVVEVAVRSWTAQPVGRRGDAPFYFIDYVGSTDTHPILYNEVVVDSPKDSPLAIDVLNGKPDRVVDASKEGRAVTRYIWDNPPSVPDEPLAPHLSETLPVVVGSTFAGWGAFRDWYRSAVKGFTEPDDQVRRLAAELTKGKKTREEKLKALFEFVADDIRYVNFVSGEWWLPNRPQELLARRQGDCDDKAMLLITLLKSIGIDATEVLIQTRYTAQPSLLRSEKVAIPVFDHGIAYLPGQKGEPGIWLDATSPESRLGPVPSMDARTVALFVDDGPPKIIETPASSPDEHGVDAEWTLTLSPSGAGEMRAKERHTGDAAFELRMNLKQEDARAQWVEQYLASGWFPAIEIKGNIDFQPDLPKGAAVLGYGAHSDGFARREGNELAVPIAEASTLTSQLAPLVKRTLPVVLPPRLAPGHETRTITIVAPPGYAFADLPPGGEVAGGEFGKAQLEFKTAGKDKVIVKRSVVFDMSTIPVAKYPQWRAWLQRVDGLMHRMVRLVPTGKAAAPALPVASGNAPAKPGKAPAATKL